MEQTTATPHAPSAEEMNISTSTSSPPPIRIMTFNVNGLKAVLQRLYGASGTISRFLEDVGAKADIVCLQETKLRRSELTASAHQLASADRWDCFFSCSASPRGYSGTATFCRTGKTLPFAAELGFSGLLNNEDSLITTSAPAAGDPLTSSSSSSPTVHQELLRDFSIEELRNLDTEGRVVITDHGAFVLFNIYAPAVTKEDPDQAKLRLAFKMRFYTALQRRWEALLANNRAVIVVGDMNIAPGPLDYPDYDPEYYRSTRPDRIWLRDLLLNSNQETSSSFSGFSGNISPSGVKYTNYNSGGGGKQQNSPVPSFIDCFRVFYPDRKDAFTVWSTATGARSNNYGSRIDLTLSSGLHVGKEPPPGLPSLPLSSSPPKNLPPPQQQQLLLNQQLANLLINNEVYISAADIEPTVQGSDHCPAWVEVSLNPNNNEQNQERAATAEAVVGEKAAVVVFPCSQVAPPCAMRFCGKQTKLHSWLAMGKNTTTNKVEQQQKEALPGEKEKEKAAEDVSAAAVGGAAVSQKPAIAAPGAASGSGRPKQMSLKAFVKVSSTTASDAPPAAPEKTTEPITVTASATASATDNTKTSSFFQAELQAAAAQQQKQLSAAKGAWQAIQQRMQTPTCLHGDPAALKKVNKTGPNQGRFFYMCARGKGQGPNAQCSFFKWVEKKPGDAPRTTMQDPSSSYKEESQAKRFKK
jgi:AP endonuclease-2